MGLLLHRHRISIKTAAAEGFEINKDIDKVVDCASAI